MPKDDDKAGDSGSDATEPSGQGRVFVLAMILAALAGFVDATGYIHFRHLFVSFMSGNSTQAMVAAAAGDLPKLVLVGRTILLFVAGVTVGELCGALSERWGRTFVLLLEVLLLGTALGALRWGSAEGWIAAALALAMGVQNAAVHKAEGISVALTYVTGTLVHVGRSVAKAVRGAGPWRAALPFVGLWIGLIAGGLAGAVAASSSLMLALEIATAAGVVLLLWAVISAGLAPGSEPG